MKKLFALLSALLIVQGVAFSQAKKPTIMVVPGDGWCIRNGYYTDFNSNGTVSRLPDYTRAFQEDPELRVVISAMSDFMAANDFPLQSLEQELARVQNEGVEMAMMAGKNSGAAIEETPIEALRRTAKADIILNVEYTANKMGPRRQIEFNIQAIDAYSSKVISGNTGTSSAVSSDTPMTTILEESVLSFKDHFLSGLQSHFDDLFKNGREISVTLFKYENSPIDFEEEYEVDGEPVELAELIEDWFVDNTVSGRYSLNAKSANRMRFNQVRIPLYATVRGRERAIDAQQFGNELARYLKKAPFNLTVCVTPKGLGEVCLTVGDK